MKEKAKKTIEVKEREKDELILIYLNLKQTFITAFLAAKKVKSKVFLWAFLTAFEVFEWVKSFDFYHCL